MTLTAAFTRAVGRRPEGVWSAPGRVNLIGEHTDHNDGYVLPFAIPARTAVAGARRADRTLVVRSLARPGAVVRVPVVDIGPGRPSGWAGYPAGVVWALRGAGYDIGGADLMVGGDVPEGAGLSSSAALECATALAVSELWGVSVDRAELAGLARLAENEIAGVPCGPMDQAVSMLARPGHTLFLDTRSGATDHVPFDPAVRGLAVLVIDTRVRHELAGSGYADRRAACARAAALIGVPALRDATEADLAGLPPVLARRARHVVTENARVLATVDHLRAGRIEAIGPALTASHVSLRDDFAVSVPALDTAVDAALAAGALGARLTGGGFGGSVIALVPVDAVPDLVRAVTAAAARAGHPEPTAWPVTPSAGAARD